MLSNAFMPCTVSSLTRSTHTCSWCHTARLTELRLQTIPGQCQLKLRYQMLNMSVLQALGVTLTEGYKRIKVEEPAKRKSGVMVSSVAELMEKLRNEAKVLWLMALTAHAILDATILDVIFSSTQRMTVVAILSLVVWQAIPPFCWHDICRHVNAHCVICMNNLKELSEFRQLSDSNCLINCHLFGHGRVLVMSSPHSKWTFASVRP